MTKPDTDNQPDHAPAIKVADGEGSGESACSATLLELLHHHEKERDFRVTHASEVRESIEKMDADESLRPSFQCSWEKTKSHNLHQAAFHEEWGMKHERWIKALRLVLSQND